MPVEGAAPVFGGCIGGMGGFGEIAFLNHNMLVIDDTEWDTDLKVIRSALVKKRREFKASFIEHGPSREVNKELRRIIRHANRLFAQLYPTFNSIEERTSFRPMVTGPEPLHFDTYGGPNPMVTAYINVSTVPRIYGVGPNFPMLVRDQPAAMRRMLALSDDPADLSYVLREHPESPLVDASRHRVEMAPGAIWFFNAKTVSHEVIYGTGVVGISWEVPGCGAAKQADLLKELKCVRQIFHRNSRSVKLSSRKT